MSTDICKCEWLWHCDLPFRDAPLTEDAVNAAVRCVTSLTEQDNCRGDLRLVVAVVRVPKA